MYTVVIVDELGCLNLFLSLSLSRARAQDKIRFVFVEFSCCVWIRGG